MNYECYAFLTVNYLHNCYPIKNGVSVIDKLLSLGEGDMIYIEGLGRLMVEEVTIDDYPAEGGSYFQEISINTCDIFNIIEV